jgi:hypothetical protein
VFELFFIDSQPVTKHKEAKRTVILENINNSKSLLGLDHFILYQLFKAEVAECV